MIFKFWVYLLRNAHDIMKIVEVTQKGTCNIFERHRSSAKRNIDTRGYRVGEAPYRARNTISSSPGAASFLLTSYRRNI